MKVIIIPRSVAAAIWRGEIDGEKVKALLNGFAGVEVEGEAVALTLEDQIAERWLDYLRNPPAATEPDLSRALADAFVLAQGIVPDADNRFVIVRREA